MLKIYSEKESPRLLFITQLVFDQLLGIKTEVTNDLKSLKDNADNVLNYSSNESVLGVQIQPWSILFEDSITQKEVSKGKAWYGLPTLILDSALNFDPLAMSFYLVSRYEEYGGFEPDVHKRFPAEASCLVQHDLIQKPLVNLWALRLLDILKDKFPALQANPRKFEYLSTIDIDQAWKYRNKGVLRNWGGAAREISKRDWEAVKFRWQVLLGYENDPFYNYDWQDQLHLEHQIKVQYFIQVGGFSPFDKSISTQNPSFRNLIERIDTKYKVGIHPSYQSNRQTNLIGKEKKSLEKIIGHEVVVSRQHYLMHSMPDTYEKLVALGIREDHTMGYSTHIGFRAGIAAPFPFFNLKTNQVEDLTLIPFCLMDITPLHYLQKTPDEAEEIVADLIWEVRNVGGLLVSLWHNESLSEDGRWKGWRRMYEYLLKNVG